MTDDPKIKPSPNRRSRESAMMIPDLDYVRQRQAEMRDPSREDRYQPGFKLEPTKKDEQPVTQCNAKLHHGPGHQSTTPCRLTGDHDVHEAVYGNNQFAQWTSDEAMTGSFDEPPVMDDPGPSTT